MSKKLLSLSSMDKILKEAGSKRVSESAKIELKTIIEDKASEVAAQAVKFSHHAKRKTIKSEDIKLASKYL